MSICILAATPSDPIPPLLTIYCSYGYFEWNRNNYAHVTYIWGNLYGDTKSAFIEKKITQFFLQIIVTVNIIMR